MRRRWPALTSHSILSLDEARKLRVGVIIPTQAISASLQQQEAMLQAFAGKQLTDEERQQLLVQEVIPAWGGDPQVAIKALEALGIEFVPIEDSTLPQLPDTARPLLAHSFKTSLDAFLAGLQPRPLSAAWPTSSRSTPKTRPTVCPMARRSWRPRQPTH